MPQESQSPNSASKKPTRGHVLVIGETRQDDFMKDLNARGFEAAFYDSPLHFRAFLIDLQSLAKSQPDVRVGVILDLTLKNSDLVDMVRGVKDNYGIVIWTIDPDQAPKIDKNGRKIFVAPSSEYNGNVIAMLEKDLGLPSPNDRGIFFNEHGEVVDEYGKAIESDKPYAPRITFHSQLKQNPNIPSVASMSRTEQPDLRGF